MSNTLKLYFAAGKQKAHQLGFLESHDTLFFREFKEVEINSKIQTRLGFSFLTSGPH